MAKTKIGIWILAGLLLGAGGVYLVLQSTQTSVADLTQVEDQDTQNENNSIMQWTYPGAGAWENPDHWTDQRTGEQRLPGPNDTVLIPGKVATEDGERFVIVQITSETAKEIKALQNDGLIEAIFSQDNPQGILALKVAEELFNEGIIQGAHASGEQDGGAVHLQVQRLENRKVIAAGTSEQGRGGTVRIEGLSDSAFFLNNNTVQGGSGQTGRGGDVTIESVQLTNLNLIQGGASLNGPRGGDVIVNSKQSVLNRSVGLIWGGQATQGQGGDVLIQAKQVRLLSKGQFAGGQGQDEADRGQVSVRTTEGFEMEGTGVSLQGGTIEVIGQDLVMKNLRVEALRSTAKGIVLSSCNRIDLSGAQEGLSYLVAPEGQLVSFGVPQAKAVRVVLDQASNLKQLAKPTVEIREPFIECAP